MFKIFKTKLHGCFEVHPLFLTDNRGCFVKIFHQPEFMKLGLETDFTEEFYSRSFRNVIRGMHFQSPPSSHVKVVYCVQGEVQDVVLDLRKGSPTYGQTAEVQLSARQGNFIYIPKGLAHGFCVKSEEATLIYKVTSVYDPNNDTGILWNSFDFLWATSEPIISDRDLEFLPLNKLKSPFI